MRGGVLAVMLLQSDKIRAEGVFAMKRFRRAATFFLIPPTPAVAFALLGAVAGRARLLNATRL